MPVRPLEKDDILTQLEKCVNRADWNGVSRLAALMENQSLPLADHEISEQRRRLQKMLVSARVARVGLAASLVRVRAADGFTRSRALLARQELAAPAES